MAVWRWLRDTVLDRRGSSRAMALVRIGLVLTMWARLAESVRPFDSLLPERLALSTAFFVLTPLVLLGVATRFTVPLNAAMLLCIYFVFGQGLGVERVEPWSHHHIYAMMAQGVLLAFTPAGRSFSVDRWLAVRRARREGRPAPSEEGPLWATSLMLLQVAAIYAWSAYDKTFPGFLLGDRMGMMAAELYFAGDLPDTASFDLLMAAMGSATVAIEWVLPLALLFRRTHWWSVPLGLLLHGIIFVSLPVGTFSATMWLYYLAILSPDLVHRTIDTLVGASPGPPRAGGTEPPSTP